jgi:indole-3-glycerol phosphate synthase
MAIPSVLTKILATKQDEIAAGKAWVSAAELTARAADMPPTRGFERALALDDTLLGVNNRNLHTFETSLDTSVRLKAMLPPERLLVTESGIKTTEDVARMRAEDIHAFLVGEAFMREADPGEALRRLFFAGSESA